MKSRSYLNDLECLLLEEFVSAGYKITNQVTLDSVPESKEYEGLVFALDGMSIIYRKGKVTPDRPGAFLAVWRRPSSPSSKDNKPIPFRSDELDYLFVQVGSQSDDNANEEATHGSKKGMFIFPVSLLIEKRIVSSTVSKGKTGFRVFPPWSQDRGVVGTKVFSASGKNTQRWQLPYFLEVKEDGVFDSCELNTMLNHNRL